MKMTQDELNAILASHKAWLKGEEGSRADLSGANLSRANLTRANLTRADLSRADLSRAGVPLVENLDSKILETISQPNCTLDMEDWHTCETTHCRAGWAIHLAGEAGYALEKAMGSCAAGALIYAKAGKSVPNFYASTEDALKSIKSGAKAEGRG